MNVFEMEGFLHGKCLPGDMRVNETTAEYLVRKLSQAGELTAAHSTLEKAREVTNCPADVSLQEHLKQLVAENAAMKESTVNCVHAVAFWNSWADAEDKIHLSPETPATDSILHTKNSEIIEWLDTELSAIDSVYRGDPSYTHDAYWMKCEVQDLLESARKAFCGQLREGKAE